MVVRVETKRVVRAVMSADPAITPDQLRWVERVLDNRTEFKMQNAPPTRRVLPRKEAAAFCGRSVRFIDGLVRQGHLRRVTLPGRTRGCGVLAADLERLVAISAEGQTMP